MSFPFETEEAVDTESVNTNLYEYGFHMESGKLTGDLVEGLEAIKIWLYLALNCARYRYVIYSWDYGSEIEEMIGKSYSDEYLETECKRMVEECLLVNDKISSIDNLLVTRTDDKLKLSFTVNTIYGEVKIDV